MSAAWLLPKMMLLKKGGSWAPENEKCSDSEFASDKYAEGGASEGVAEERACLLRVSQCEGRAVVVAHHEPVVAQHNETHDTANTIKVLELLVGSDAGWDSRCCG